MKQREVTPIATQMISHLQAMAHYNEAVPEMACVHVENAKRGDCTIFRITIPYRSPLSVMTNELAKYLRAMGGPTSFTYNPRVAAHDTSTRNVVDTTMASAYAKIHEAQADPNRRKP